MENVIRKYENLLTVMQHRFIKDFESENVYNDFKTSLYNELKFEEYFEFDIFEEILINHVERINHPEAINYVDEYFKELYDEMIESFNTQIRDHFLIVPMQHSHLEEDIIFGDLLFLTRRSNQDEYISDISQYLNLNTDKVKERIDHTHNTRSKDFLNDNVIVYKIKNHTSFIKMFGFNIMNDIFNFIRIIYYYNEASTSFFHSALTYWNTENKHVLILAEDDWRNGHDFTGGNKSFYLNYNLSFLDDKQNQELLYKFMNTFLIGNHKNELTRLFYNAIELFNRAIKYKESDEEVYILLMMTTAETLLTQNRNEKRLRLSAIIPRIIEHKNLSNVELAGIIKNFYLERNNFVHSGSSQLNEAREYSETLAQIMSKLIVNYFTFTNEIVNDSQTNQLKRWNEYVNEIFENIILGIDNDINS